MIKGLPAPKDLDELTRESIRLHNILKYADREAIIAATPSRTDANYQRYIITSNEKDGVYVTMRYFDTPYCAPDHECPVSFEIQNNSKRSWRIRTELICPDGFYCDRGPELFIEPGEAELAILTLKAIDMPEQRYNRICFKITRINDGSVWSEYRLPFTVLRPNVWIINGEKRYEAGCSVTLDGDAPEHVCETTLYEPQSRKTTLICNTERPVKLELDGKILFDSGEALYLPAYHRSPGAQRANVQLEEGEHRIRVTVKNNGKKPVFTFSVNSTGEVSEPGSYYAHIDALLK